MVRLILLLVGVLSINAVEAQGGTELQILKHVNYLSTDSLSNRAAGSSAERDVNNYIRENWGNGKRTSFYSWEYSISCDSTETTSEMVGSLLGNKSKATILLCAELESASDIALLLGLQNELAQLKLDVNVMVVGVTSKDNGHQGLDYLATHMPKKAKDIKLLIYLNGIGNMAKINPELSITATSGIFQELQTLVKLFAITEMDTSTLTKMGTQNYIEGGIQRLSLSTNSENPLNTGGVLQIQDFLIQWIKTK